MLITWLVVDFWIRFCSGWGMVVGIGLLATGLLLWLGVGGGFGGGWLTGRVVVVLNFFMNLSI